MSALQQRLRIFASSKLAIKLDNTCMRLVHTLRLCTHMEEPRDKLVLIFPQKQAKMDQISNFSYFYQICFSGVRNHQLLGYAFIRYFELWFVFDLTFFIQTAQLRSHS